MRTAVKILTHANSSHAFTFFLTSKTIAAYLLAVTALLLTTKLHAAALPFFSAHYDATVQGIPVSATRTYEALDNGIMRFHLKASSSLALASIEENVEFTWDAGIIRPIHFRHLRKVLGKKEEKQLRFDWEKNQALSIRKNKTSTIDLVDSTLDRLSFQLQLQHDLLNDITTNNYRIINKKRIKQYHFKILKEETLTTQVGEIKTLKIKVDRASPKRLTYFWVAPDWHNLLVRLEQFEEGNKEFELELTGGVVGTKTIK